MKRKCHRRKHFKHLTKTYKRIAAAVAGAVILSSAALPGINPATAHANPTPDPEVPTVSTEQTLTPEQAEDFAKAPDAPLIITSEQDETIAEKAALELIMKQANENPQVLQTENPPPLQTDQYYKPGQKAGPAVDYKQVLSITATAYAPGAHDNDQWGSKTFIGSRVRPGIIAVDPRVIPLHSHVYIEYPDGHGAYAVAEDTGGAIKGNRIDVAKWTVSEAEDFGIQHVKVYVLEKSQNENANT